MQLVISSPRFASDELAKGIVTYLGNLPEISSEDAAVMYYEYPIYSDYDQAIHRPDISIWSRKHGFVAIRIIDGVAPAVSAEQLAEADEELSTFCGLVASRMVKSKVLKRGVSGLKFDIIPIIYIVNGAKIELPTDLDSQIVTSREGLSQAIVSLSVDLSDEVFDEGRSIIEGGKALAKPRSKLELEKMISPRAAALAALEREITNFDERQRRVALSLVPGPHRIRGLAGSGKTVILAMKVALLHLNSPEKRILLTFYTKSLRATLKALVTRFFRHFKDQDPDWEYVHIVHGWGGSSYRGVYSDACRRAGLSPIPFREARQRSRVPFAYVCNELVASGRVEPYYDYVLIDEGQDFPDAFYELAYHITKDDGDERNIIWAYDELQNILKVKIRTPEELFGFDDAGEPRISLDRSAAHLPVEMTNDSVLQKCYRNQREVLVTAHALGFGIYGTAIVQLLEDAKHWEDVGYRVVSGTFEVGDEIVIERPPENSPIALSGSDIATIDTFLAESLQDELEWVLSGILDFVSSGIPPHAIMVITLDDQNARTYLNGLSRRIVDAGLRANNLLADEYTEPPFTLEDMVTLSTVYRAKGNEAAVVFVVGIDAMRGTSREDRNKIFTAFTRSKAWLRVSGIGPKAQGFFNEIDTALKEMPYLRFEMPDLQNIELIQRDLSKRSEKIRRAKERYLVQLEEIGVSEEEADLLLGSGDGPKKL